MGEPSESAAYEAPKVTITWTLRDYYRSTWDLSDPEDVSSLARILGVDEDYEGEALARAVQAAAEQVDDMPDYDVADAFADISHQGTWFDRDTGDCVRVTDVTVE